MMNNQKIAMNTVLNTNKAINIKDLLNDGDLVYDMESGFCLCKNSITNKFGVVTNEEDAPCLGSECPKRDNCYKYNLAKKFSEDEFLIRDLSTSGYQTDTGWEIYCNYSNRYRCFRWND